MSRAAPFVIGGAARTDQLLFVAQPDLKTCGESTAIDRVLRPNLARLHLRRNQAFLHEMDDDSSLVRHPWIVLLVTSIDRDTPPDCSFIAILILVQLASNDTVMTAVNHSPHCPFFPPSYVHDFGGPKRQVVHMSTFQLIVSLSTRKRPGMGRPTPARTLSLTATVTCRCVFV